MQEIEPEEQAGDLLIDETLFEEDKEDLPKEQLRNTSAAYLLQLTMLLIHSVSVML